MKEYFFLIGKDQIGPLTIEQLADKEITNETLIWTEGMENWQKLKDIPELSQMIKPKSVPPPPPSDSSEKNSKTEVIGQLKITTEKTPNLALEAIKPNKTTLKWLIVWCSFHLFVLLMSYSRIRIFNTSKPETDEFWPFVEYYPSGLYYIHGNQGDLYFQGYFHHYDWTEFSFYVGGVLIIFLLVRISNKDEQKKL